MSKKNPYHLDVVSVRLVKDSPILSEHPILSPRDAVLLVGEQLCEYDREVVCLINMKADCTPINCHFVSIGTLTQSLAHPREIFKAAFLSNAVKMILIHNHPSSTLRPSIEDIRLTERMVYLCEIMEIPLVDHIIVGGDNDQCFSFRNKGLIKKPDISFLDDYTKINFQGYVAVGNKGVSNL